VCKQVIFIKTNCGYELEKLKFIGEGIHGKVYLINPHLCIKIFKQNKFYQKELETLKMAQGNKHFPKIFSWGENYIVREYIDGIELDKYLKSNELSLEISSKIINLYDAFGEVGYLRQDAILFHILVTENCELKVIDTARVMKEKTKYPRLILDGLKKLGYNHIFLEHVRILRPDLYKIWSKKRK
jgi:predicted Ser/Thr protein kinase